MNSRLIIIGGAMRTGTSVLQSMLCTSPDTHGYVSEYQYLTAQLAAYKRELRPDRARFLRDYFETKTNLDAFTGHILNNFLEMTAERFDNPSTLVLKNPELTLYLPEFAELIPEAKFLVCIRDPKDVVASMLDVADRQRRNGAASNLTLCGRDMTRLCALFKSYYRPLMASKIDRIRTLFVRYEDLITRTEGSLQVLQRFCGVGLDGFDRDADWTYQNPSSGDSPFRTPLFGKGLSAAPIGRYRQALSVEEIAAVDSHCADIYRLFKYAPGSPSSTPNDLASRTGGATT